MSLAGTPMRSTGRPGWSRRARSRAAATRPISWPSAETTFHPLRIRNQETGSATRAVCVTGRSASVLTLSLK